jgi:tetratricopeptide (TPR) repeat protein
MISDFAVRGGVPAAADAAAALTPGDAEARDARAGLFADAGDYAGAESAYLEAIALRPRDYVLWVELGKARDQKGDAEGALAAFKEATQLAPFYAQPRWQLGNALLRAGRREEAAEELRRAAASDPRLYPNLIQALWYAGGRDPRALVADARPQTPEQTLVIVKFLVKAGAAGEGIKTLRDSGAELSADARRSLVADLLAAYDFAGAYEVWSEGRGIGLGAVSDGGFEAEARTDDAGFGWQFAKNVPALKFSLDADSPREGRRSLKVEYAGNSEPATPAISQLILVEPGARYRLTFAARSKELVTGGPPFVQVTSAGKGGEALASAAPLSPGMTAWQDFSVEFNAPPQTTSGAVRVALLRQPCTSSPCPAFGSVWLDAFELRRL